MFKNLLLIFLSSTLFGATQAGEVYKWTDETGHTHYGSAPPDSPKTTAKAVALQDTTVSEEQRTEAEERLARQKASLGHVPTPQAPSTFQNRGPKSASSGNSCKDQWKKYQESASCFDRYRVEGGGVKSEAYKRCTEVQQPEYCSK